MSTQRIISAALAALILGGMSVAQQAADRPDASRPVAPALTTPEQAAKALQPLTTSTQAIPVEELLIPIHTQPDDPAGGAYGTWAAGPNYKASFHNGYAFYPLLGPDYPENLPLGWRTDSVTVGGTRLFAEGTLPVHQSAPKRYEYRFPGVVEAYDVLLSGVEQTFTISERPGQAGDLLIKGRVTTNLRAARQLEDEHGKITFRDAKGKDILTYGEAFAADAQGRKTKVTTTFDGTTITLKVAGAWLAEAAYPVVVDPLTANVIVSTWGGATFGLASFPSIGRDDESTTKNIMTFYARQFSASDFDGYARLTNNDFTNTGLVYTDITTSWSTGRAGVASVGGPNRWTLCLQRDFGGTTGNRVRIYLHDFGNTTLNSGITLFPEPPAGQSDSLPEVGGTRSFSTGNDALLVFQNDISSSGANTLHSEVYGILVNASGSGSFGTRFRLASTAVGTQFDRESPCVNQESNGGTASWIVGFQELDRNISGDDWDVYIARITSTGTQAGLSFVGPSASAQHKLNARIAGRDGRYMASYALDATEIQVHRFDWLDTAAAPVKKQMNTVASGGTADYVNGGIAFDTISDSHWAVIYQRGPYTTGNVFIARVGYTGGTTESATVYSQASTGGYSPSITFDDDSQSFLLVYASTENPPAGLPVFGRTFNYPTTAINVLYGVGCGPATISADAPLAGDEFWQMHLSGATPGQPAILIESNATGSIPLASSGMGLCFFNLNATVLFFYATATNAGGTASLSFPLPDEPVFIGNVYWQWFYGFPAAPWATKFAGTQGLRTQIR